MTMSNNFCTSLISTFKKNRIITKHSYPITVMSQRIFVMLQGVLIPWILYKFIFSETLSNLFVDLSNTNDYITFIVVGSASFSLTFSTVMNVGRSLIIEQRQKTLNLLKVTPISINGYMLGVFLEQFIRSIVEFFVILFIGKILGAKIYIYFIPVILIYLLILSISSYSISFFIAWLMVYSQNSFIVQNTIISVLLLICGITIPLEFLPIKIQFLGKLIPIYWAIDSFRNVIIYKTFNNSILNSSLIALLLSVCYLVLSTILINRFLKKL